jgi:hypothetical protein
MAAIVMLSMTYLLFNNPFFYALNLVAVPSLFFLHMTLLFGSAYKGWADFRLIASTLDHLIPQNVRHWFTAFGIIKSSAGSRMGDHRKVVVKKISIGLTIAVPLLLVILNLLASADHVFNDLLSGIPEWMDNVSLGGGIGRLVWTCLVCLFLFGYLWGFVEPRKVLTEQASAEENRVKAGFRIDPIIMATVLVAINLVYVLFVAVQFSYLFGVLEGALPEGSSYAEYARSGFFELLTVSILNFIIMLATLVYGEQGTDLLQKIIKGLLYVLLICSAIMLYSAYMRLVLYEEAYGYTYIRFLVHAFMIYLGLLLIVAGLRIAFKALPTAKIYIVISLVAYVVVNYAGMDQVIATKNIERFRDSGKIDTAYLRNLSTDAASVLIRFSREEHPVMANELRRNLADPSRDNRAWQSFNLSRFRAERALERYFSE